MLLLIDLGYLKILKNYIISWLNHSGNRFFHRIDIFSGVHDRTDRSGRRYSGGMLPGNLGSAGPSPLTVRFHRVNPRGGIGVEGNQFSRCGQCSQSGRATTSEMSAVSESTVVLLPTQLQAVQGVGFAFTSSSSDLIIRSLDFPCLEDIILWSEISRGDNIN